MKFVDSAERHRDDPVLVIDVRSNGGGKGDYGRDFFVNLTSQTIHEPVIEDLVTPTTTEGTINWATCVLAQPNVGPETREHFTRMRDEHLAQLYTLSPDARSMDVWTPQFPGKAPKPFAGTVVVLTNRDCGSACDDFVMFARELPTTLVVGENTRGVSVFGEVRQYRLPKSGMWINAGRKWFHDPDGSKMMSIEGHGHEPDIWLDGPDPLLATLEIARCVKRRDCGAKLRAHLAPPDAP